MSRGGRRINPLEFIDLERSPNAIPLRILEVTEDEDMVAGRTPGIARYE